MTYLDRTGKADGEGFMNCQDRLNRQGILDADTLDFEAKLYVQRLASMLDDNRPASMLPKDEPASKPELMDI